MKFQLRYLIIITITLALMAPTYASNVSEKFASAGSKNEFIELLLAKDTDNSEHSSYDKKLRIRDGLASIIKKRFACLSSNATGNWARGRRLDRDILELAGFHAYGPNKFGLVMNRYIIGASCRLHSCTEKGMVIYDTENNEFSFAIMHHYPWATKRKQPLEDQAISAFIKSNYTPKELQNLRLILMKWSTMRSAWVDKPDDQLSAYQSIVKKWAKNHKNDILPIRFYHTDCAK